MRKAKYNKKKGIIINAEDGKVLVKVHQFNFFNWAFIKLEPKYVYIDSLTMQYEFWINSVLKKNRNKKVKFITNNLKGTLKEIVKEYN